MLRFALQLAVAFSIAAQLPSVYANEVVHWNEHLEAGDFEVPSGTTLVLRGNNQVSGQLRVASGAVLTIDSSSDNFLQVESLDISGSFLVGSEDVPYNNKAIVELACGTTLSPDNIQRKGVVVQENGEIALFGAKGSRQSWVKLVDTAEAGSTCLQIDIPDDWRAGDEIVIPSTDFDPHQTEKRTIVSTDKGCVEIDRPLEYSHFGRTVQGTDQRAEIGLLTRNIVFRGCHEAEPERADLGGHMIFLRNFKRVQIQAVELQNFGQGDQHGRYPFHFHLCSDVPERTFLRHNSVHDSNFRGMTLHGTQGVTLESNVVYNVTGHAIMLEDGAEFENKLRNNLVVLVKAKNQGARLQSDGAGIVSAFWLTNPDNVVTGNAVAAVEGAGFWLHTRVSVKGASYLTEKYDSIHPYKIALGEVHDNAVHSATVGFEIDSPELDPVDDLLGPNALPSIYTPDKLTVVNGFSVHHCRQGGWFRMFRLHVTNWVVADVTEGVQIMTQGNTALHEIDTYITDSLFVGSSANHGNLVTNDWQTVNFLEQRTDSAVNRPSDMRMGIQLYDGPVYISNCTFTHWYSQSCLDYINPAIGARENNGFAMPVGTFVRDLVFEEVDYPLFVKDRRGDGGKTTSVIDITGSISGHPSSTLLPDWDFYATDRCHRSARWGLACPHSYANFDIVAVGPSKDSAEYGLMEIHRNTAEDNGGELPPRIGFEGQYIPASQGWLYHPILSPGAVYTLRFEKETPSELSITMSETQLGQIFTLVICYPAKTSVVSILDHNAHAFTRVESVSEMTCTNCFLYDTEHHVLVLRLEETGQRIGAGNACPLSGCTSINIQADVPVNVGVDDAVTYALANLKIADISSWTSAEFPEVIELVNAPSRDWCALQDPCVDMIDVGNRHKGIMAYFDDSCAGIGCFSSSCRYCKMAGAAPSSPFLDCPSIPSTGSPETNNLQVINLEGPPAVLTPISMVAAESVPPVVADLKSTSELLSASNPEVTVETINPSPASSASLPLQSPTAPQLAVPANHSASGSGFSSPLASQGVNKCAAMVPSGDRAVGISAIVDATCASGGVGCFNDSCRYCKVAGIPGSSHLPPCESSSGLDNANTTTSEVTTAFVTFTDTDNCWNQASPFDLEVGVASIVDPACKDGGLGCHSSTCRFCKTRETPESQSYPPCPNTSALATTPAEATSTRIASFNSSLAKQAAITCKSLVASADITVGISVVDDALCGSGGLGCVHSNCRFCRTHDTAQSQQYLSCEAIVTTQESRNSSSTESQQTALQGTVPVSAAPASSEAPTLTPTAPVSSADPCSLLISSEETSEGVFAFTDSDCPDTNESSTESGCFHDGTCRRCRATATTNSSTVTISGKPLHVCPEYVVASYELASASAPANLWMTDCALAVSFSAMQSGISAYGDATCGSSTNATATSTAGCFARLPCRYCSYNQEATSETDIPSCLPMGAASPKSNGTMATLSIRTTGTATPEAYEAEVASEASVQTTGSATSNGEKSKLKETSMEVPIMCIVVLLVATVASVVLSTTQARMTSPSRRAARGARSSERLPGARLHHDPRPQPRLWRILRRCHVHDVDLQHRPRKRSAADGACRIDRCGKAGTKVCKTRGLCSTRTLSSQCFTHLNTSSWKKAVA